MAHWNLDYNSQSLSFSSSSFVKLLLWFFFPILAFPFSSRLWPNADKKFPLVLLPETLWSSSHVKLCWVSLSQGLCLPTAAYIYRSLCKSLINKRRCLHIRLKEWLSCILRCSAKHFVKLVSICRGFCLFFVFVLSLGKRVKEFVEGWLTDAPKFCQGG